MSPDRRRRRPKKVLVFGEDENDTHFLAELLVALCPEMQGMVKAFRRPPILIKDADSRRVPDRATAIASLVDAEATSADVVCVFAHEDCDDLEPAHEALSQKIEAAFAQEGYHVHAVTPAWETEAWLFLWPEAVAAYRGKWRSLDAYRGRNVGLIVDAKETLTRALRPTGRDRASVRDYRESDAPGIGARVREMGIADDPRGRSASYDRFRASVTSCCQSVSPRAAR